MLSGFFLPGLLLLSVRQRSQLWEFPYSQSVRETKQKTLEEIAASFGDKIVEVEATEEAVFADAKLDAEHSEHRKGDV